MSKHTSTRTLFSSPEWPNPSIKWWAAWELLDAVRELFPEKFAELDTIRNDLFDEFRRGETTDPRLYTSSTLPEPLLKRIQRWTKKNCICCDAVDQMAALIVAGDSGPPAWKLEFDLPYQAKDAHGRTVNLLSIRADPFGETLDEFVLRAKSHYNQVWAFYQILGLKKGPTKRERDHFRYLAARLVGGYSWPRIARDHARLNVSTQRSPKTVAGETHKTARLVGISLPPGTPGRPRHQRRRPQ